MPQIASPDLPWISAYLSLSADTVTTWRWSLPPATPMTGWTSHKCSPGRQDPAARRWCGRDVDRATRRLMTGLLVDGVVSLDQRAISVARDSRMTVTRT